MPLKTIKRAIKFHIEYRQTLDLYISNMKHKVSLPRIIWLITRMVFLGLLVFSFFVSLDFQDPRDFEFQYTGINISSFFFIGSFEIILILKNRTEKLSLEWSHLFLFSLCLCVGNSITFFAFLLRPHQNLPSSRLQLILINVMLIIIGLLEFAFNELYLSLIISWPKFIIYIIILMIFMLIYIKFFGFFTVEQTSTIIGYILTYIGSNAICCFSVIKIQKFKFDYIKPNMITNRVGPEVVV